MAQMLSSMGFSTIFPFLPNYIEHLGSSTGSSTLLMITLAFSVQSFAMALASPVWGAMADRWGRKPMAERAMYGGAILVLLMGFARSAEELILLRLIQGLVTGVASAGASMVASTAPRERLGYAMGLMQTGLWTGVSVGPMLGGLLEHYFGFRAAFVLTGVLLLVAGLMVSTQVRENFKPQPRGPRKAGRSGMLGAFADVLRLPGVSTVMLVRFVAWLGRNMIMPFLPLFVVGLMANQGAPGIVTGIAIGAASAAGTAASLLLGRLSDRVGHLRVVLVCAGLTALLYLPMAYVTEPWQLIVLYTLTGASVGGVLPAISAILARLTDPAQAGSVYGLDNSMTSIARGLSPIVGGAIVAFSIGGGDPQGLDYGVIFLASGLLFGLTAILAWWKLPKAIAQADAVASAADTAATSEEATNTVSPEAPRPPKAS